MRDSCEVAVDFCAQAFNAGITGSRIGLSTAVAQLIDHTREEMRLRALEIVDGFRPGVSTDLRHAGAREACDRIIATLKTPDIIYKEDSHDETERAAIERHGGG